jgi:hypothetical protein
VNVFARELSDDLASLVKQLDEVVGKNKSQQMAGFVVLLTEDPDAAEGKLKEFAEKHGIKNMPLTTYGSLTGPPSYKIAKDADVTVHMWRQLQVKANHAFGQAELKKDAIKQVVGDTAKILN